MSAQELINMLTRIGYPGASALDPNALEWAFEDDKTSSFMQFVCSIGTENVLTQDEIDEYRAMENSGQVLTGQSLRNALAVSSSSRHDEDDDGSQHGSDMEQLEQSVVRLRLRKKALLKERQLLDAKQMTLKSKQSRVDNMTSGVKKKCDDMFAASNTYSCKINEALGKLSLSVKSIARLYKKTEAERGVRFAGVKADDPNANFLSQIDLSAYHQAEERFSQDLTGYAKKRFFEGMADIAGTKETDQYSLLDVSHPENISVDDESDKEAFMEDCREFALLQRIFPKSEINRLNALVNTKKAINAVYEAKSMLQLLKSDKFPTSSSTIGQLQLRAEDHIRQAQGEASQYQSVIPDLVKELGTLQGTEILTGNYELKLKRQDYFTKNQERVTAYLEGQRSRSELLLMFYDLELKFHERSHHLLCAAEKMLESHLHDWNQRMKCLDDPDLSRARFERNVVDSRDVSSNSAYQMMVKSPSNLATTEDSHLYLPLDKVKDKATALHSTYQSSRASQRMEDGSLKQNLAFLEEGVEEGETSLYAESSTLTGLPSLSPADVQASMVSLQGSMLSLSTDIRNVVKAINQKKKMLKGDPVLVKEREMYSLFHTKPDRLVSIINGLEERLKVANSRSSGARTSRGATAGGL